MDPTALLADPDRVEIAMRLAMALAIGALIGLERSHHGRPAGFRTHALVCMSTALLMLITVYESRWVPPSLLGRVALDPTRMAQGIMTGIGFLGAGTIMRQGLSVRGLTTAASIWMTAAIGLLVGIGFLFPAVLATLLTLGTLSVFRWLETALPTQYHAQLVVRFAVRAAPSEARLRALLADHGFSVANLGWRLDRELDFVEYRMSVRSRHARNAPRLADGLDALPGLREARISPSGD
jgi:putative Mg2+ transporter-C (MgtC) family protein